MISASTSDRLASEILLTGALELRNVPRCVTNEGVPHLPIEKQPFLYASGNWGPGYVSVKGQVGRQTLMVMLCSYLAFEIAEKWPVRGQIDFVAGNVTGGVVPGWVVSQKLSELLGRTIPFVYIRELRKTGGQKELITGIQKNPEIARGDSALDMEELVNFAETIRNGVTCLREAGYKANRGACILYYANPVADNRLAEAGIEMVYLLRLSQLIEVAERIGDVGVGVDRMAALADYRQFLENPLQWQANRGLTHVEKGGTK
ncbi:MAG: hypothetical protein V1897_16300 [Pseudomonadota bacterium]